jgi:hypothetical protein
MESASAGITARAAGHEQHAVGTADGLFAVEEPRAALPDFKVNSPRFTA